MRTRRLTLRAIMTLLSLTLAGLPAYAQESSNTPIPTHQKPSEPTKHQDAPAPSLDAELSELYAEIGKMLINGHFDKALPRIDSMLQTAQERKDKVAEAYARRARALALQQSGRYEEADDAWEQAAQVWREIGDGVFVVEALSHRAMCLWQRNRQQAEDLVAQSLTLATAETNRPVGMAEKLRLLGVDWLSYDDKRAVTRQYYELSFNLCKRYAPQSLMTASALINLGALAKDQRRHSEAEDYLKQSLTLLEKIEQSRSVEAGRAWFNLGQNSWELENYAHAKECFEHALAIYREQNDPLRTARTLHALAGALSRLGEWEEADKCYRGAESLYRELNRPREALLVRSDSVVSAYVRGDLDEALRRLQEALEAQVQLTPCEAANTMHQLGNVYADLGDLDRSAEYIRRALDIYKRQQCDPREEAKAEMDLSATLAEQGNLSEARQGFERARNLLEEIDSASREVALCWMNLGVIAIREGKYEDAKSCFERAYSIYQSRSPIPLEMARLYHNLASTAVLLDRWEDAERYATQAMEIRERYAPDSLQVARSLYILAAIDIGRNRFDKAYGRLQRAITIIENQRQAVADSEIRTLLSEQYFDAYSLLAFTYLQENQPDKAAETLERSRARSLAETLYQRELPRENLPKPLQELLKEQEQLNNQRLLVYQRLRPLKSDKDAEAIDALHKELTQLDQKQRALDARLRKEFPEFASQLLPEPLTIQQIQQSLEAGTVLLYHALVGDHLLIVAVSPTEVRGYVVEQGKQIEQQAKQFRELIERLGEQRRKEGLLTRPAPDRRELAQMGQQLYNQLLEPAQAMLQGARRVVLCPDGVLSQLPWAALVVKTENGRPVYWIEQVALHLTPSMGVYQHARKIQPARQGVLIAAVSEYRVRGEAQAPRQEEPRVALLPARRSEEWDDLPQVKEEAERLQQLFGAQAQALLDAEATPDKTRQTAQGKRVVHFAGHARANHADPLGSFLKLAPPLPDQGKLTAGDILTGWKLQADLVMLSACETGLGVTRRYEGVYSLARAFLYAGSRSVGASLWRVDDASTAQLMEAFYQRYQQGVAKDEALRQAQLELLRKGYADPYYWAGFMLIGDYRSDLPRAGSANTLK